MATPEIDDRPASSPLDSERARLRQDGYTDAEISQILIARVAGVPPLPTTSSASPGVLSQAISSLVALWTYARGTVFSIRSDVAAMFDGKAPASVRAGATASLAVKAVVIAVLGYAAAQEWNQHIISAPAIADAQARKTQAEAETARQTSLNADLRQKAEAKEAEYKAEIARQVQFNADIRQRAEADAAKYDAETKRQTALNADLRQRAEAKEADYKAEIARQTQLNAEIRQKAEADAARYDAEIKRQVSLNAQVLQKGQAEEAAAKARSETARAKFLERLTAPGGQDAIIREGECKSFMGARGCPKR